MWLVPGEACRWGRRGLPATAGRYSMTLAGVPSPGRKAESPGRLRTAADRATMPAS